MLIYPPYIPVFVFRALPCPGRWLQNREPLFLREAAPHLLYVSPLLLPVHGFPQSLQLTVELIHLQQYDIRVIFLLVKLLAKLLHFFAHALDLLLHSADLRPQPKIK